MFLTISHFRSRSLLRKPFFRYHISENHYHNQRKVLQEGHPGGKGTHSCCSVSPLTGGLYDAFHCSANVAYSLVHLLAWCWAPRITSPLPFGDQDVNYVSPRVIQNVIYIHNKLAEQRATKRGPARHSLLLDDGPFLIRHACELCDVRVVQYKNLRQHTAHRPPLAQLPQLRQLAPLCPGQQHASRPHAIQRVREQLRQEKEASHPVYDTIRQLRSQAVSLWRRAGAACSVRWNIAVMGVAIPVDDVPSHRYVPYLSHLCAARLPATPWASCQCPPR